MNICMHEQQQLGMLFKQARKKQAVSQLYVARCLGHKNPSFISRVERGQQVPSLRTAKVWADLLGIEFHEIVDHLLAVEKTKMLGFLNASLSSKARPH